MPDGQLSEGKETEMMRTIHSMLCLTAVCFILTLTASPVSAQLQDFAQITARAEQDGTIVTVNSVTDSYGQAVREIPLEETVYVAQKVLPVYPSPDSVQSFTIEFRFGAELQRLGTCENGYSHVILHGNVQDYEGYVDEYGLSDERVLVKMMDTAVISTDCDIMDYPSRRDGDIVGELLAEDVVTRIGSFDDIWTRIVFQDDQGGKKDGYILTTNLKGYENTTAASSRDGSIHKSTGRGVFAEAVDKVTQTGSTGSVTSYGNVLVGTPEAVGEGVTLLPVGVFRITHYCPCSICCGPYADGITSTGTTAITNHTIAVQPSQIPYGSRVVINGQVFVAEDCGGAIKENCIDVYVATHEEALAKGVFYTEVYVIQ